MLVNIIYVQDKYDKNIIVNIWEIKKVIKRTRAYIRISFIFHIFPEARSKECILMYLYILEHISYLLNKFI